MCRFCLYLLICLTLPACGGMQHAGAVDSAYTVEAVYAKLLPQYPHLKIASRAIPSDVVRLAGLDYMQYGRRALQLDLYLPVLANAEPGPAIVMVHGGGWRTGDRSHFTALATGLAQRGYVVASISYRLSPEARYPAAIHDVKAAIRWVRTHAATYGVHPGQIAVLGASAGGQMASLAGVTNHMQKFDMVDIQTAGQISSEVQAVINIDGLSDFSSEEARRYEDDPARQPSSAGAWFGGRYAEKPAIWHEASPITHVNKQMAPVLFILGSQRRYSLGWDAMVDKMNAIGITSRVIRFNDAPHNFWLFDPWVSPTIAATDAFLKDIFQRR